MVVHSSSVAGTEHTRPWIDIFEIEHCSRELDKVCSFIQLYQRKVTTHSSYIEYRLVIVATSSLWALDRGQYYALHITMRKIVIQDMLVLFVEKIHNAYHVKVLAIS